MDNLNESNIEFKIKPGSVYRENRLMPVTTKYKGSISMLRDIKRSTIKSEELVCCLISPDESEGIFVDVNGTDYVITSEELQEKLTFINSKFRKTIIPRYTFRRGSKEGFKYLMDRFLSIDMGGRYKGWKSVYGIVGETEMNESVGRYKEGRTYITDDKEFKFTVVKKTKDGYRIRDVKDNKEYEVELSDLELLRAKEV